jgi:hypothetical protein
VLGQSEPADAFAPQRWYLFGQAFRLGGPPSTTLGRTR